jgi:hypothetical protein
MTPSDPVLARLARLPVPELPPDLSSRLRDAAYARLRPRRLHPVWTLVVAGSVISYLTWALRFASHLYMS